MIRFITLYILLVITLFGFAQAEIKIDKKVIKFPKTKEGKEIKHTYKLANTGNEPLIIQQYEVACSCTKIEYQETPILPGKEVDINLFFDTKGKIGWQDREVLIYSNAKNSPTKIRFKVMINN